MTLAAPVPSDPQLPENAFSEAAALEGIRPVDYGTILGKLKVACRFGKLRRIVVNGMPFYYPPAGGTDDRR